LSLIGSSDKSPISVKVTLKKEVFVIQTLPYMICPFNKNNKKKKKEKENKILAIANLLVWLVTCEDR